MFVSGGVGTAFPTQLSYMTLPAKGDNRVSRSFRASLIGFLLCHVTVKGTKYLEG